MTISYRFLAERNMLVATAAGPVSPADNERSNHYVKTELDRHPGLKLLVDMRAAQVAATPVAMIAMVDAFFALVGHRVPTAIVTAGLPDDPNAMIVETKAFIANARIKIFDSVDDATAWLERQ
tara:strand:- start:3932 stop:4300 length:369 start_codon:yes stop_codon:yes gene_type:complete